MESKSQPFAEDFRNCCLASCSRLAYERQQNSEEFAARSRRCGELYELIQQKLGGDGRLIDEFDNAKNMELAFDDEFIYQQGFQDCVYLFRWLGIL